VHGAFSATAERLVVAAQGRRITMPFATHLLYAGTYKQFIGRKDGRCGGGGGGGARTAGLSDDERRR